MDVFVVSFFSADAGGFDVERALDGPDERDVGLMCVCLCVCVPRQTRAIPSVGLSVEEGCCQQDPNLQTW